MTITRDEMVRKLSKVVKRVIVRIQPYMTEVHKDILENLKHIKNAGAFGVTVEGMKFAKSKKGLVKVGADFCYDIDLLKQKYMEIKEECHNIGLAFYCAENRLRELGDDFCCCGISGLEGFRGNKNNLLRKLKGLPIEKRECQNCTGTGRVFLNCFQDSKTWHELKGKSYEEAQEYFFKRRGEKLMQDFNIIFE
jgi:DNA repair photolyase